MYRGVDHLPLDDNDTGAYGDEFEAKLSEALGRGMGHPDDVATAGELLPEREKEEATTIFPSLHHHLGQPTVFTLLHHNHLLDSQFETKQRFGRVTGACQLCWFHIRG